MCVQLQTVNSNSSDCRVFYTKQHCGQRRCLFYRAKKAHCGAPTNRGQRKQITNSPNQTVAAAERDDTSSPAALSRRSSPLRSPRSEGVFDARGCINTNMRSTSLSAAAGSGRSRPGATPQPERDPARELLTEKIHGNLLDLFASLHISSGLVWYRHQKYVKMMWIVLKIHAFRSSEENRAGSGHDPQSPAFKPKMTLC